VVIRLTAVQAEKLRGLWQEHSGALHGMLVGWCGDPQNAADVLQEVFRRLAASPALMAKMNNARAFLAVSARRIAVDFARRSAARTAYHTAAGGETPSSENPGPTDEALRVAIRRALESLPAEQRAVFEHKVLKGRTLEETSKLESIPLNTAASRLRYAIDKIRGQLRPYYEDLNRKDFKNMKNDPSKTEDIASERIITPLAPKRVPSVAPGLEGLAAMAPDDCEAAPEIAVSEPEFVEAAPAAELVEPEIAFCGVGGNAWEQVVPEAVELPAEDGDGASDGEFVGDDIAVTDEFPEMVTCEIFPWDGEIPDEWLKPILVAELPEDFLVNLFEGEGEPIGEEAVPYELESGFEICVLPVPEEFYAGFDPNELLARYEEFLSQDPTWLPGLAENQGDWFHEQVTTSSAYFEKLEFGTAGEANAFDHWFASNFAAANTTGEEIADLGGEQPDYADDSWSFDPKDLLVRYEDFLRDNPDWGALDPDTMEIQVVTPSSYFGDLEFGTPGKAAAFDSWYEVNYAQHDAGGAGLLDGSGLVLDGSSDFDGGTVLAGGNITWNGEIQPHWRGGGGPEFAYSTGVIGGSGPLAVGGIKLGGSEHGDSANGVSQDDGSSADAGGSGALFFNETPLTTSGRGGGDFPGTTVVTGGEVILQGQDTVEKIEGNTLTLSSGSTIVLQGGQVMSEGKVYAFNPEVGSNKVPDVQTQEGMAALPMEVAVTAETTSSFGNAAAGLAPTANQALIVEFGVLSPSEAPQAPQISMLPGATDDLPQAIVSSGGGTPAASNSEGLSAAHNVSASDDALPHVAASAQVSAPVQNSGIQVDAPTTAAGAVAAGTVVHGGASAPSIRRPVPSA
jgi:RNA polymerase sigma-70 factor (ECF subfamily)